MTHESHGEDDMSEQYHTLKEQRSLELVLECARSGKPKCEWY